MKIDFGAGIRVPTDGAALALRALENKGAALPAAITAVGQEFQRARIRDAEVAEKKKLETERKAAMSALQGKLKNALTERKYRFADHLFPELVSMQTDEERLEALSSNPRYAHDPKGALGELMLERTQKVVDNLPVSEAVLGAIAEGADPDSIRLAASTLLQGYAMGDLGYSELVRQSLGDFDARYPIPKTSEPDSKSLAQQASLAWLGLGSERGALKADRFTAMDAGGGGELRAIEDRLLTEPYDDPATGKTTSVRSKRGVETAADLRDLSDTLNRLRTGAAQLPAGFREGQPGSVLLQALQRGAGMAAGLGARGSSEAIPAAAQRGMTSTIDKASSRVDADANSLERASMAEYARAHGLTLEQAAGELEELSKVHRTLVRGPNGENMKPAFIEFVVSQGGDAEAALRFAEEGMGVVFDESEAREALARDQQSVRDHYRAGLDAKSVELQTEYLTKLESGKALTFEASDKDLRDWGIARKVGGSGGDGSWRGLLAQAGAAGVTFSVVPGKDGEPDRFTVSSAANLSNEARSAIENALNGPATDPKNVPGDVRQRIVASAVMGIPATAAKAAELAGLRFSSRPDGTFVPGSVALDSESIAVERLLEEVARAEESAAAAAEAAIPRTPEGRKVQLPPDSGRKLTKFQPLTMPPTAADYLRATGLTEPGRISGEVRGRGGIDGFSGRMPHTPGKPSAQTTREWGLAPQSIEDWLKGGDQ